MHFSIKQFSDYYLSKHNTDIEVNMLWNELKNFCSDITEKEVPSKLSTQRFNQPWVTRKIKSLSIHKKRALRRFRHTQKPEDLTRYKELQKTTQRECRKAYNSYIRTTVSEDPGLKKLYSFFKSRRYDSSGIAPPSEVMDPYRTTQNWKLQFLANSSPAFLQKKTQTTSQRWKAAHTQL